MNRADFSRRFNKLADNDPLHWQWRLFHEHFAKGELPSVIDLPTGLGKTMVMAIWLIARTMNHSLPRRLVYVVDRRAVVDQATELALKLRDQVEQHDDFKQSLGLSGRALPISTLRGQHVDNLEWLEDPASPAIIVGTVDMIGSRLLFEGYGTSRKMRPYHAGLLGADTLVVLDESHLVPPFERLLETIEDSNGEFGPCEPLRNIVPKFKLMSLSATGRTRAGKTFGLTEADFDDVVKLRLKAPKRLTINELDDGEKLSERIAKEAWGLSQAGTIAMRVIVFCHKREDAEAARKEVEKLADAAVKKGLTEKPETELFVGGRRVFERQKAVDWLRSHGFLAGSKVTPTHAVFVFATSAGEVGVDLDADHMVCDLVAWERMVQRLGRVNRRGEGDAKITVVASPDPTPGKAVKEALTKSPSKRSDKEAKAVAAHKAEVDVARARRRPFDLLARDDAGIVEASPGAIRDLKLSAAETSPATDVAEDEERSHRRSILAAATTPAPLRPALTRALVDAWSMTSLKEHTGRPIVEPWLRGWIDDEPQTAIVWRKHLPVRRDEKSTMKLTDIAAFFEAAPPHASETLEAETFRVMEWLEERAKSLLKAAKSASAGSASNNQPPFNWQDVVVVVLDAAGDVARTVRLEDIAFASSDKKENDRQREEIRRAIIGATVVVDARVAGLGESGLLDAEYHEPPQTLDDGTTWLPPVDGEEVIRFRVRLIEDASASEPGSRWRTRFRLAMTKSEDDEPSSWLTVEKWRHDAATGDDGSEGRLQTLAVHQQWAHERATKLADRLGLTERHPHYATMLGIAARLHDEGKKSPRWQRAFKAPAGDDYAKTPGPVNVALLDGYRHEFGSLPVAGSDTELLKLPPDVQELALHLIAAHHGFARPLIGIGGCDNAPPSALEDRARDVALRFARLQKRWGPWGLAWWESLLRAVDQAASRDNDIAAPDKKEIP